jgi:hypothetical protein
MSPVPGCLFCQIGSVMLSATVAVDFSADGRWCPI